MVREKIGLQTDRQTDGHGDNISVFFSYRKKALKIIYAGPGGPLECSIVLLSDVRCSCMMGLKYGALHDGALVLETTTVFNI